MSEKLFRATIPGNGPRARRLRSAIAGHFGVHAGIPIGLISSGKLVSTVLTIQCTILSGPSENTRAIQGELAHVRRHARRAFRRAV